MKIRAVHCGAFLCAAWRAATEKSRPVSRTITTVFVLVVTVASLVIYGLAVRSALGKYFTLDETDITTRAHIILEKGFFCFSNHRG